MRKYLKVSLILVVFSFLLSCTHRSNNGSVSEAGQAQSIVHDMEELQLHADSYPEEAIITGHILNRDVYPNTEEVTVIVPFFGDASQRYTAKIGKDNTFKLILTPYAMREVSMFPFADRFVIAPGDSLHLELDFKDMLYVKFSGRESFENQAYNTFCTKFNYDRWSSYNQMDAGQFTLAMKKELAAKLEDLKEWINSSKVSEQMADWLRKKILVSYYNEIIKGLSLTSFLSKKGTIAETGNLDIEQISELFDGSFLSYGLYELTRNLAVAVSYRRPVQSGDTLIKLYEGDNIENAVADNLAKYENSFSSPFAKEMLAASALSDFLERNQPERFLECSGIFNEKIHHPLLKYSLAKLYMGKKAYKENPQIVTDYFLKPANGDSDYFAEHPGAELLKELIKKNEGKVLYISIGAVWCPPCIAEIRYKNRLMKIFEDKSFNAVSIYVNGKEEHDKILHNMRLEEKTETIFLSREQYTDLDKIIHLNSYPYYILVDPKGRIVDYGEHIRPDFQGTQDAIEQLQTN